MSIEAYSIATQPLPKPNEISDQNKRIIRVSDFQSTAKAHGFPDLTKEQKEYLLFTIKYFSWSEVPNLLANMPQ
jgi:hypothetical protein